MRKFNRLVIFLLVTGLLLTAVHLISAQQRGEGRQQMQVTQQFDSKQMMARRMQQIMERLKLSEEKAAVLKPKIEGIQRMRMEQQRAMDELIDNLQKAIDAKNVSQIKAALTAVKAKRAAHKAALEKAETDLIKLLTMQQEADLTVMGVVNSDGMGFHFGGPGGPGGPGQGMELHIEQEQGMSPPGNH